MVVDDFKHKGMRRKLVDTLRGKGITDESVLSAINEVPRHIFFDPAFVQHSYQDKAFPIGEGQTISQPFTVAYQTQLLQVQKGMKVLEIGTGSGYQACVLLRLGVKLFSVERQKKLYEKTVQTMQQLGYKGKWFCGDGTLGLPAFAPFDRIIVTAGAPTIPQTLVNQLSTGGRIIVPVGDSKSQEMILLEKDEDGSIKQTTYGEFRFVPLIGKEGWT